MQTAKGSSFQALPASPAERFAASLKALSRSRSACRSWAGHRNLQPAMVSFSGLVIGLRFVAFVDLTAPKNDEGSVESSIVSRKFYRE